LAQLSVPEKTKEITAIPDLLDHLAESKQLEGALVTIDLRRSTSNASPSGRGPIVASDCFVIGPGSFTGVAELFHNTFKLHSNKTVIFDDKYVFCALTNKLTTSLLY